MPILKVPKSFCSFTERVPSIDYWYYLSFFKKLFQK